MKKTVRQIVLTHETIDELVELTGRSKEDLERLHRKELAKGNHHIFLLMQVTSDGYTIRDGGTV